jgi:hypothetical protein
MPHASVKLLPGVDQNKTPALNEAGISDSQLVRFIPDRTLGGLIQKLGGWQKYVTTSMGSIVRCLWAWQDTNAKSYLGVGAEASLKIINNDTLGVNDVTPQTLESNDTPDFTTTSGSNQVLIVDGEGTLVDQFDVVYIKTQVSVGGLILFGLYPCAGTGTSNYFISAFDVFGEPTPATATVASGGVVPEFDTVTNSAFVEVTLPSHGLSPGDTFPILISTSVGGLTLFGNYIVASVTSSSIFTIRANQIATSTASVFLNGGDVNLFYYNNIGPLPPNSGYGAGGYGEGGYGAGVSPPVPEDGTPITTDDWSLDNWGEILIANPRGDGIFEWSPSLNDPVASIIAAAPPANNGMFVAMPQRQIIAYGSTFTGIIDPLLIRWCDVDNYDVWFATVANQAGSYRIPKGSRIVQAIQGPQQGLIWTDLGVYAMQYVGPPYVYQFNELGNGCGLIGRKAAGSMNGIVYWMGPSQFFRLSGAGVEPIKCPIWDVIFQDLDTNNLEKIRFGANSRFGELRWEYPSLSNGGEVSHYVKYNVLLDQWDYGKNTAENPYVSRTAWINESVIGPPIGAGEDQFIYQHETSPDADGQAMVSSFRTGYFVMNEADLKMFVDQVWPDMKWGYYGGVQNANVNLTFYVADYPGDTPIEYGPYVMNQTTQFITPRFRGRLVAIQLDSNDIGTWWRIGNMRYRFQQDGRF